MATNKKPTKRYKPKDRWLSPMAYVKENLSLLCEFDPQYVIDLKIKDHSAMTAVIRGEATRKDMDIISATFNIVFGSWKTLNPPEPGATEFATVLAMANLAFRSTCTRANEIGRVVCKAEEIQAFNDLIDLHDNLLDVLTVKQWGEALAYAKNHAKKTKLIPKGIPA